MLNQNIYSQLSILLNTFINCFNPRIRFEYIFVLSHKQKYIEPITGWVKYVHKSIN